MCDSEIKKRFEKSLLTESFTKPFMKKSDSKSIYFTFFFKNASVLSQASLAASAL